MRLCLLAAVVACTFAVPYGVQAQRSSCGGDTPNWLLVTVIGVTDTLRGTDELTLSQTFPDGVHIFIKACDLDGVMVHPDAGETIIDLKSEQDNLVVRETPAQICAALPTCNDATLEVERLRSSGGGVPPTSPGRR